MNYSSSEQLVLLASRRHQLHCRVIGTLLTTGVVLGFGGFAADVLMEEGLLGEKKWASRMQIVWSTGMAAFLLAIMPTHATSVQVACLMWLLWATLGAFNAYMQVLPLLPAPPTFWRTRERGGPASDGRREIHTPKVELQGAPGPAAGFAHRGNLSTDRH